MLTKNWYFQDCRENHSFEVTDRFYLPLKEGCSFVYFLKSEDFNRYVTQTLNGTQKRYERSWSTLQEFKDCVTRDSENTTTTGGTPAREFLSQERDSEVREEPKSS